MEEKIRDFRFYKDTDLRWYVDLPEWEGPKSALEMVEGADVMLEIISENTGECTLTLSEEPFDGCETLHFIREATEIGEGGFYEMKTYGGIDFNLEMWLCGVTEFVFGKLPNKIYLSKLK